MGPISRHITPLVINSQIRGGHTHTNTQTHIQTSTQEQFQETRCAPATGQRTPGLKRAYFVLVPSAKSNMQSALQCPLVVDEYLKQE